MSQLPRLPVPDIRKTLDGYLRSVQPILLADEHSGGPSFAAAYARQQTLVNAFLDGPARRAQARLRALDRVSPHNWLDDNFWMKKTYLEWRAPLLLNSNWWLTFVNDPNVPPEIVTSHAEGITPWQVRRAACLVHGILDFKHKMRSQELYPDTTRIGLWLRHSTAQIFNLCRLPQHPSDALTIPAAPTSPWASTVTLLAHDFYYALCVVDPVTGAPLHVDEIERGMRAVVADVQRRRHQGELPIEIGVLSSDNRDEWSRNYSTLLSISLLNKHSFEAIHQSLFVVSLDHWPAPSVPADQRDENLHLTFDVDHHPSSFSQSSQPLSTMPSDLLSHQSAIRSSPSALNRFFDKPLSLIVEPSTRAGAMGEHSPVDALVPSVVCEWAVAGANGASICGGLADVPFESNPHDRNFEGLEVGSGSPWTRLDFVSSSSIQIAIENAKQHAQTLVSNSDHQVSYFEEWGGEEMKRVSSYRPDAFVQLALQLAYFRIHRCPTPVYEAALTRTFQHARTETIRSFTTESYAFLAAIAEWKRRNVGQKQSEPSLHLYSLLQSALKVHCSLTRSAMMGRGIDRHLLGLQCILGDEWTWLDDTAESASHVDQNTSLQDTIGHREAMSQPISASGTGIPLFEDTIFKRSQEWRLSTSGLSEGWWFRGTGFGSPYEDGYGINYLIGPHAVKFCVESKHSCPTTSTRVFIEHVADALRDMRDVCLSVNKSDQEGEPTSTNAEFADMPNASEDRPPTNAPDEVRQLGESALVKSRL